MASAPRGTELSLREFATPPSGARSSMLLAGASAASIVLNYVFLLAAGRVLGNAGYGSLAALLGLLAVVLIPAGALQMAVSREISRRIASDDSVGAEAFARTAVRGSAIATVPLVALALALAIPLAHLLHIDSVGVIVLAELTLATALVYPVTMGVIQGAQRFHALAALYIAPFLIRLPLFGIAAALGYRLGAAILATLAGAVGAAALALALIREPLKRGALLGRSELRPFLRYLTPVAAGLIGIALLTHLDILIVKARLSADDAGNYAAASAFARVGFFLPATILAVLFPRTAARQARGEETEDILGRSLLATIALCGALAVFYAATGTGLISATFGTSFSQGGVVLAPFALAIGLYSLAYILVGYHLSRGESRYAWIIAGGVVIQVAALAVVPRTLNSVVWANLAVAIALVAAHEVFVGSSARAVQVGFRHLTRSLDARARSAVGEGVVVVLVATILVCALFWQMVTAIGSTVVGLGPDASGTAWWLYSLQHEGGYHLFGNTHHTLTGAPFGWDGANGLNIQWLLPYYPAYLATTIVGPIAAQNLVLLAGYVLSGAAMYLLVRYLGCGRLVAAWAGLVYIVFPWHLERTPHTSLVHLEFLPLLLLTLLLAARTPTWPRFALVATATVACWLTSGYFGTMAVVGAVAFALGVALTNARRRTLFLLLGVVGSALGASILITGLSEISGVGRGSGLHRATADLYLYGLRPIELVVPTQMNFVFGHWTRPFLLHQRHVSNRTETSNYLGVLTIALAVTWLVIAWRNRSTLSRFSKLATAGFAAVAVASLLLALPSPVSIFGHHVWMPSGWLWEAVPPFRVPARWVVLAMAALVPLGAFTLQEIAMRAARVGPRWSGARLAPVAVVGAAMIFSFLELAENPAATRFSTKRVPAEYSALSQTPDGIVAEYPLAEQIDDLFWQLHHHRSVLNTDAFGTPADDEQHALVNPSTPGTAEQLATLGVTAIITHPDSLKWSNGPAIPNPSNWGPGYRLVARAADGSSVWDVVAPGDPALISAVTGFTGPVQLADKTPGYALIAPSGVGYLNIRARQPSNVRISLDARPPKGSQKLLRLADASGEHGFALHEPRHISVVVAVPRGFSLLLVKTDPPARSVADAIMLSRIRIQPASGQPQMSAVQEDPNPGF